MTNKEMLEQEVAGAEEIETMHPLFAMYPVDDEVAQRLKEVRLLFSRAIREVERIVPGGRERSIAITELQTAGLWAINAVIVNSGREPVD